MAIIARVYVVALVLLLVSAACAPLAAEPSTQMTEAPDLSSATAAAGSPEQTPGVTDGASPVEGGTAEGELRVALVAYPAPGQSSAADLMRQAYDCHYYKDIASERLCLEEAAATEAGSRDAGRALALLADTYAKDDPAQAEALFAQVKEQYPDPEVQAFADLVKGVGAAARAEQWEQVEQLLTTAAVAWRDSDSGVWAELRLADHYRFEVEDWDEAIAAFKQVLAEHGTGPVAEEAAVALAECVNWSETQRVGEAIELYQSALAGTDNPCLRIRALIGLGHCNQQMKDWTSCWDTLSVVVNDYPSHPAVGLAAIIRGSAAEQLGDWEAAVEEAKRYLASSNQQPLWRTYANHVLAQEAFRAGQYDEAESRFAFLAQVAEKPQGIEFRGPARAGIGACREMMGDRRGALQAYLEAADCAYAQRQQALYLYRAAGLAEQMGDRAAWSQIAQRMAAELPGSHLTSRLLGYEVLSPPDL